MLYQRSIMCHPRRFRGPPNRLHFLRHHEYDTVMDLWPYGYSPRLHTNPSMVPGAVSI